MNMYKWQVCSTNLKHKIISAQLNRNMTQKCINLYHISTVSNLMCSLSFLLNWVLGKYCFYWAQYDRGGVCVGGGGLWTGDRFGKSKSNWALLWTSNSSEELFFCACILSHQICDYFLKNWNWIKIDKNKFSLKIIRKEYQSRFEANLFPARGDRPKWPPIRPKSSWPPVPKYKSIRVVVGYSKCSSYLCFSVIAKYASPGKDLGNTCKLAPKSKLTCLRSSSKLFQFEKYGNVPGFQQFFKVYLVRLGKSGC